MPEANLNHNYEPEERKPWIQSVVQRLETGDRVNGHDR